MPIVTPRRFQEDEEADVTAPDDEGAEEGADESAPAPDAAPQGYDAGPAQTSPYAVQGQGSTAGLPAAQEGYAAHPSDWSRPMRDVAFQGPTPAAGSLRFAAEQAAVNNPDQRLNLNDQADLYERANAPMAGYQRTGPGQFSPIQGGPADPRMQQPPPGMAMLRTANGMAMMPDTPGNRINDLNHTIALAQLSPSEERRSQDLRNAMQTVRDRIADGTISAQAGNALGQQIQQRGQELWARQGTVAEQTEKLRLLQAQAESAHRIGMLTGDASHVAQEAVRSMFTDPVTGARYHVNPLNGSLTEMKPPAAAKPTAPVATPAQAARLGQLLGTHSLTAAQQLLPVEQQLEIARRGAQARYNDIYAADHQHYENQARTDLAHARAASPNLSAAGTPAWMNRAPTDGTGPHDMSDDGIIRRRADEQTAAHHRASRIVNPATLPALGPGGAPAGGQQGGGQSIFAPPDSGGGNPPPPANLRTVGNSQRWTLANVRAAINNPRTGTQPRVVAAMTAMRPLVEEAHTLSQVPNRTTTQQARYLALDREIDEHLRRRIEVPTPRSFFEVGPRHGINAEAPAHPLSPVGIGERLGDMFHWMMDHQVPQTQ